MASGKGRTPAMQALNLGDKSKEITLKTNELKCCMASGNGRTPAGTHLKKELKNPTYRQIIWGMNKNVASLAEKGGHQQ